VGDAEDLPSLADTIEAVRRELSLALAAGQGQPVQFRAGPVELDLEVAVTRTGRGPDTVSLRVLTWDGPNGRPPAGRNAAPHAPAQRIKVTLQPAGHENPAVVAEPDESALPERPVQAEGLEVHEVDDGLVVYQAQPECVHHLNNTAAIVFELCNGDNTVPEISEQLAAAFGLSEMPAQVTEDCIADLWSKGVIK
jgi:hypothetical protein